AEPDHSRVTQEHLAALQPANEGLERLARALGAHHGSFQPRPGDVGPRKLGAGHWEEARDAAITALADVFAVHQPNRLLAPDSMSPAAVICLAGLVTVADWIGSDDKLFPRSWRQFSNL